MRLLMLAAIHRVYEPGCKFEIMVCQVIGEWRNILIDPDKAENLMA